MPRSCFDHSDVNSYVMDMWNDDDDDAEQSVFIWMFFFFVYGRYLP